MQGPTKKLHQQRNRSVVVDVAPYRRYTTMVISKHHGFDSSLVQMVGDGTARLVALLPGCSLPTDMQIGWPTTPKLFLNTLALVRHSNISFFDDCAVPARPCLRQWAAYYGWGGHDIRANCSHPQSIHSQNQRRRSHLPLQIQFALL
jgi:hypothetical protein